MPLARMMSVHLRVSSLRKRANSSGVKLWVEALPEEDVVFFTVKDCSYGMVGTPR